MIKEEYIKVIVVQDLCKTLRKSIFYSIIDKLYNIIMTKKYVFFITAITT